MTPTRKTGERSDISREREKQKKREKRDKKNNEGIAPAPKGSTDANDLGESSSDEAYTSVCVGYALATFALFVLLLSVVHDPFAFHLSSLALYHGRCQGQTLPPPPLLLP